MPPLSTLPYSNTGDMPARLKQTLVGTHVRARRKQAGLSVRALAKKTGFSPSFVSQLERGRVSPSIHSMEKLAAAVGVTLGSFFAAVGEADAGLVLSPTDRRTLNSSWSNAQIEALAPPGADCRQEAMLVTLGPKARSGKHPVAHPTEEFAYVITGRPLLRLGPDEHALRPGHSVVLRAGELRLWTNPGSRPARVLIVALRQRR